MKKKIFYLLVFFIILALFFQVNKKKIGQFIQINFPYKFSQSLYFFYDFDKALNRLGNDYNVKFLPQSELINLVIKKIPIHKILFEDESSFYLNSNYKYNSFYLETYQKNLFILNSRGNIFYLNFDRLEENNFSLSKIDNNLNKNFNALDIFIYSNKVYVSGTEKINNCNYLNLYSAKINLEKIFFENIFKSKECSNIVRGGKIQKISTKENKNNILLSTFADPWEKDMIEYDPKPQDDKSIFGKILIINEDDLSYSIFSKGHRNIQGLINLDDKIVISTEHGPNGGDEINKIIYKGNYGWNEVSYGKKYFKNELYLSNHQKNGFIEPVYVFLPSIGISEIISIDKNFAEEWSKDFVVSSLNSRSLYRIKFNDSFNKVIYQEKIFIGERIRDLKLSTDKKLMLLALEESGSILILKKKDENK